MSLDGTYNGQIAYAIIGIERDMLYVSLVIKFEHGTYGFGPYSADYYAGQGDYDEVLDEHGPDKRQPSAKCGYFVRRVMEITNVDSWEDVKGRYVRLEVKGGKLTGIAPLIGGAWFYPVAELIAVEESEGKFAPNKSGK